MFCSVGLFGSLIASIMTRDDSFGWPINGILFAIPLVVNFATVPFVSCDTDQNGGRREGESWYGCTHIRLVFEGLLYSVGLFVSLIADIVICYGEDSWLLWLSIIGILFAISLLVLFVAVSFAYCDRCIYVKSLPSYNDHDNADVDHCLMELDEPLHETDNEAGEQLQRPPPMAPHQQAAAAAPLLAPSAPMEDYQPPLVEALLVEDPVTGSTK